MAKFLKGVRKGSITGPQQLGFTPSVWTSRFFQYSDPDELDVRLHASGIWFGQHLTIVRDQVKAAEQNITLPLVDSRRLLVAIANSRCVAVHREIDRHLARDPKRCLAIEEFDQIDIPNTSGNPLHPGNAIDTIVDGLRFPLAHASTAGHGTTDQSTVHEKLVVLGEYYSVLEHVWMQCVWNNYAVIDEQEKFTIRSLDPEYTRRLRASWYRRTLQPTANMIAATSIFLSFPPNEQERVLSRRWVLSARPKGSRLVVKASPANRFPGVLSFPSGDELCVDAHLKGVFQKRYRTLRMLTPNQVLAAFELLGTLPRQITRLSEYHASSNIHPHIINRLELQAAFQRALVINTDQSAFIIGQMSWGGDHKDELWFRPLIPLGPDQFAIPFGAIDGINHLRLADELLHRFPEVRTKADEAFEPYLRAQLTKAIQEGPIKSIASVHPKSFQPGKSFNHIGDIDLLVVIGSRILVGELKSAKHAYSPLEESRYVERLRTEAVTQAKRKADFVNQNLNRFTEVLGMTAPKESIRAHPLVVVNTPLLAGFPIDGVPIVDTLLLESYFREGKWELLRSFSRDGPEMPVDVVYFYHNAAEAAERIMEYLVNPPQLQTLIRCIRVEQSKLLTDSTGKSAFLESVVVKEPVDDWKGLIAAAGRARSQSTTALAWKE